MIRTRSGEAQSIALVGWEEPSSDSGCGAPVGGDQTTLVGEGPGMLSQVALSGPQHTLAPPLLPLRYFWILLEQGLHSELKQVQAKSGLEFWDRGSGLCWELSPESG